MGNVISKAKKIFTDKFVAHLIGEEWTVHNGMYFGKAKVYQADLYFNSSKCTAISEGQIGIPVSSIQFTAE